MNEEKPLGAFPYVVGGLSFVPMIGVLFGLIAIIWGLKTKKSGGKKLALIGTGGIVFSVALYSALFYFGFVKRGGVYDDLSIKLAKSTITSLVQAIEFYKVENGHYPESLELLKQSQPKDSFISIIDPTDTKMGGKQSLFYYQLVNKDHYYLLSVGPDGKPFTKDDIVPQIAKVPGSKIGLLTNSASK